MKQLGERMGIQNRRGGRGRKELDQDLLENITISLLHSERDRREMDRYLYRCLHELHAVTHLLQPLTPHSLQKRKQVLQI